MTPSPTSSAPAPISSLLSGEIPALTVPPVRGMSDDPAISFLQNNFTMLADQGGIDFLDTDDGSTVIFNPQVISRAEIEAAQAEGTLAQLAPPIGAAGGLGEIAPAAAPDLSGVSLAANTDTGNENESLQKLRVGALKPKLPTEKPIPVAGMLNDIVKRPV